MKCKLLIVEDQDQVAVAIEHQLMGIGKFHVDQSRSATQAIDRINAAHKRPYDIILCDYNLGETTNGQQLFEYLRFERKIPRSTAFIMLTAESSYSAVASAVELVPDAYLLKPFTHDGLAQRINLALAKRDALKAAHAALDCKDPDWNAATTACNALILEGNRFALEALRLKAECQLKLGNWGEAATVYDKIIAWRPTAWAEVGRARALRGMGHPELALEKLKETLESFPQFVAAYDELAALAQERGETELAQQILERAHGIVPSNRRTRELGLLALENGDLEKASRYLQVVADKDLYGLMRSTEDFFGLVSALRQLGRHGEAVTVLDNLKDHFPETRPLTVRKMAAEAMVIAATGRVHDARKMVRDALELRDGRMEPRTQLELADACYQCGEQAEANEIFLHVAANWQENPKVVAQVKSTMARLQNPEEAAAMIDGSLRELVAINNQAAKLIKEGKLDEVVSKMEMVAKRLTNNATVQANFTQALLLWLEHNAPPNLMALPHHSKPRRYLSLARDHLKQLALVNASHPRLAALQRLFAKFSGETGIAETAAKEAAPEEAASMIVGE